MKPEAQRIAIAEAHLGVHDIQVGPWYGYGLDEDNRDVAVDIPDYLNDLNAAVELCDFLTKRGWTCRCDNGLDRTWECTFTHPIRNSTHEYNVGIEDGKQVEQHYGAADTLAEAICQAFLRATGKWQEDEVVA